MQECFEDNNAIEQKRLISRRRMMLDRCESLKRMAIVATSLWKELSRTLQQKPLIKHSQQSKRRVRAGYFPVEAAPAFGPLSQENSTQSLYGAQLIGQKCLGNIFNPI
uniref:Uncharacterized protein n=1 Tax=Meloidogyne hapla TaxID=6305 RepID=A0A1I8BWG1_MELHA